MSDRTLLSIVTPAFNEAGNLGLLYEQVVAVMEHQDLDWEMVLVDDGSSDGSRDVMRGLYARDPRVKALFLSRNFGHEIASTAGLDAAKGDVVVLMDADLQDPPDTIPVLLEKWREGYDIVSAERESREGESVFKRATAFLFYRLMGTLVGWRLPVDTGDFRLVTRPALDAFLRCRERNRFVRALFAWSGFRQTTVPFKRAVRHTGRTKYGAIKLFGLAVTSITSFSVAPLRIATWIGLLIVLLSLIFVIGIAAAALTGFQPPGDALLLASVWFLGGVQCLLIGILGEYAGRTYVECQHRPLYFVREFLGTEPPAHVVFCDRLGGECVRPQCPVSHFDQESG